MPNGNNPLTVNVTITPTSISVDQPTIVASQGNTPIFWQVASGSAPGATITSVFFVAQTPTWPNSQPASIGNGQWKVNDNNTNPGPGTQSFKYNISGTTSNGNPPTLDPNVDNDPPPPGDEEDEDDDDQGEDNQNVND